MKLRTLLMPLVLLAILPSFCFAQGKLAGIREDVRREEPEEEEDHDSDNHCDCHHHGDDDCGCGDLFGNMFLFVLIGPRDRSPRETHHYVATTSEPFVHCFPAHPYPLGLPGYAQEDPTPVSHITGNEEELLDLKFLSLRIQLENGNDFNGLNRFNGSMLVETTSFGLHTSWNYLHESLDCGCSADGVFGNIHLTFLRINYPTFQLRYGVGANIYSDDFITDSGLNFLLSYDIYPIQPLVISGQFDGGWIGDTGTWHTRLTAGYLFHGVEVYGGYDFRQIGSVNLHGPMAGIRLWF